LGPHLFETSSYLGVSAQNIPQLLKKKSHQLIGCDVLGRGLKIRVSPLHHEIKHGSFVAKPSVNVVITSSDHDFHAGAVRLSEGSIDFSSD
jgi:hypothetical protein